MENGDRFAISPLFLSWDCVEPFEAALKCNLYLQPIWSLLKSSASIGVLGLKHCCTDRSMHDLKVLRELLCYIDGPIGLSSASSSQTHLMILEPCGLEM